MFKIVSRLFSIVTAICFILVTVSVSAAQLTDDTKVFSLPSSSGCVASAIDDETAEALKTYIQAQVDSYAEQIPVAQFNIGITPESIDELSALIYDDMPLAFFVNGYNCIVEGGKVAMLEPIYIASKSECDDMVRQVKNVAETLVFDLKNNDSLSDVEKALLLHDRVAIMCEYDLDLNGEYDEWCCRTAYGVFVEKKAVCVGYAEAYDYLLSLVGIESRPCRSIEMEHMWNIVTIDGEDYHVDITWDDVIWSTTKWDIVGSVAHDTFLVSSQKLYESHPYSDYDSSPNSTKYDGHYWQNSDTSFQLLDNKLYYFDNKNKSLINVSDNATLLAVEDYWIASANGRWPNNYSRLACDGKSLYYSTPSGIYKYFTETNSSILVHAPELNTSEYYSIFGFVIDDGYLVYDINNSPNFNNLTMKRERVKITDEKQTVEYTVGNACSDKQEIAVTLSGNIIGYYWGTSKNLYENAFTSAQNKEIKLKVLSEGTYYFTPVTGSGEVLDTFTTTYHKIVLDPCCDTLDVEYIITPDGAVPSLPAPTRDGFVFSGWYNDNKFEEYAGAAKVEAGKTLYAKWSLIGKKGDVSGDGKINSLDAAFILRYDADLFDFTDDQIALGDVTGDGKVNSLDAAMVLRYDADLISGF